MDESQQSAPSVDDGRNGSVDVEHVQVKVAEKEQTKNSAFQQHQSRSSDDSRSCPTMLPFDNMAFTFPGEFHLYANLFVVEYWNWSHLKECLFEHFFLEFHWFREIMSQ